MVANIIITNVISIEVLNTGNILHTKLYVICRFSPATFLCIFKDRNWILNAICHVLLYAQWFEVRDDYSFCWYWRNCRLLLFKFSFHNEQIYFQISMNVHLLRVYMVECVAISSIDTNVYVYQDIAVVIVKMVCFIFWKYM